MNYSNISPTLTLNNGIKMPLLGLGVYQIHGEEARIAVLQALRSGYRHIDTASLYGNEREVGAAVRQSGIPRKEIFVTTKIWPTHFLRAHDAFKESAARLNIGYIDLYLIHWPHAGKHRAWKALEEIYSRGITKAIGVSNYELEDLEDLLRICRVPPSVNQVEFNPFTYRKDLLEYAHANGIALEAYSPITKGKRLTHHLIQALAKRYEKSPAQIMLRWSLQHGLAIIPKSQQPQRISENANIFDFVITEDDMEKLDGLNEEREVFW